MSTKFLKTSLPAARRVAWRTGLAVTALAALATGQAFAGAFTQGNLVVERLGDGVQTLSGNGNSIFFDEFTTGGNPVQSIAIPTTGSNAMIENGTTSVSGGINLAVDGKSLVFPGYATNLPSTITISSATAAAVPRAIGQIDLNGNYTLAVSNIVAFSGSTFRGAATDGNHNYWGSGTASSTTTNAGAYYFGTASAPYDLISGNFRSIGIYNGSLWYSTASSTAIGYGIAKFNGLPTTGSTPTKVIPLASTDSPYNFSVSPDGKTIYYADDGSTTKGIHKWTQTNGVWGLSYVLLNTTQCFGLAVNWSVFPATIYTTTGSGAAGNQIVTLTDTGASATATTLATAPANEIYRGVTFAPSSGAPLAAPTITAIAPTSLTASAGSPATFQLTGTEGNPLGSNFWFKISGNTTNLVIGATGPALSFPSVNATNAAKYFAVVSNTYGAVTSSVVTLAVNAGPTITAITPVNTTTGAGQSVTFTLTATAGTPAANNFWYQITGNTTNLVAGATNTTLTLLNVSAANAGGYFAILTNSSGSATSAVATLIVTNDPAIITQPASTEGLLNGTVQFTVGAAAAAPGYQWYFADNNNNLTTAVLNGTQASGSVISGAQSATLTIANLQFADPTNFAVVVTDPYGTVTSAVASLLAVNVTNSLLALWDFDGPQFTNTAANPNCLNNPVPFLGAGTAAAVGSCYTPGTSPFSGATDPLDGAGFYPYGFTQPTPNFSWGTSAYPLTGGNKQNGVQFNVSTVGAKNIHIAYDSRVSATASDYERLQYTIDGVNWIDYPTSSTFGGVGTTYLPYAYDLTGFPGVDNNPNFAFRVVTEFQSTATYGAGVAGTVISNYVGTANTYGTAGTVTYDIVAVSGDAITNALNPPVISAIPNTNTPDYLPITLNFTVSDSATLPDQLTYSAVSLVPTTVNGTFTFGGSGNNRTLTITPQNAPDQVDTAPILITVTDGTGNTATTWFDLTLTSINLAPTNSLTKVTTTNVLANASLVIPFTVADDRTSTSGLTYAVASGNSTVVPVANVVISNPGTASPTLTITPATNQVGLAKITVTTYDNDPIEPRYTTANLEVLVRPNTNVILVDYFNYDASGSLDTISSGFWNHLSGNFGQLKAGNGVAVVDTLDNTENLQATLVGGPYKTNSPAVLYTSFTVNMDPTRLPLANGTYFALFNDGSGVTGPYEGRVIACTNGAAPGFYRIGINNFGANATSGQVFPLDLAPGSNYVVVAALVLSNGFSTVWVNPNSPASPSVTDTTTSTNLYNIADFELRESGSAGGAASLGSLKVGTTFDSVLPALHLTTAGGNAILNWSDPTLGVQAATNVNGPYVNLPGITAPYTNNLGTNGLLFFRFGQ